MEKSGEDGTDKAQEKEEAIGGWGLRENKWARSHRKSSGEPQHLRIEQRKRQPQNRPRRSILRRKSPEETFVFHVCLARGQGSGTALPH